MKRSTKIFSKVKAAGIAGALVTLATVILHEFFGIEIPEEVAAALVTVISFIVGFFKTEYAGLYRKVGAVLLAVLLSASLASAQTIQLEPTQIAIGAGAMLGDSGVVASWDSVFAAIQWRGVELFQENVVTGVAIEIHPAAVLSFTDGSTKVQQISSVDYRVWSMSRVKMSALQLPGEIWESIFLGTDLLVAEGGSTDFTGGFDRRLVFGVQEKAGPGWIDVEITMFQKYVPAGVVGLYRYNF